MTTGAASAAIEAALRSGRALLKVISANDVGETGSHQYGFLLPKGEWRFFSPNAPAPGRNFKHPVTITWPDYRVTKSVVTWYGQGSRREFRLTRFGRDFPFRSIGSLGGVLVLVESSPLTRFDAFILESEEDIEEVQAALGTELVGASVLFDAGGTARTETSDHCIERQSQELIAGLREFPSTASMARFATELLDRCDPKFSAASADARLLRGMTTEYQLFRQLERQLCPDEVTKGFRSIDEFLKAAHSMLQRRKSRAGKSLEHHICMILHAEGLPFEAQARVEESTVDVLLPGSKEYGDPTYPQDRLLALAVKTTCKDRWRQVLREARQLPRKYLLTVQQSISEPQVTEMENAGVQLVVPSELHGGYPNSVRSRLFSVERFLETAEKVRPQSRLWTS